MEKEEILAFAKELVEFYYSLSINVERGRNGQELEDLAISYIKLCNYDKSNGKYYLHINFKLR